MSGAAAAYLVDVFGFGPETGNRAAVVLLDAPVPDEWLADMGAALDQTASAFVMPAGDGVWDIRWFTATSELELCGHGTLAAAHVLHERGLVSESVRFMSRAGALSVSLSAGRGAVDLPAMPATAVSAGAGLERALAGSRPSNVCRTSLDYFVELADAEAVHRAEPDLGVLAELPVRGLILTAGGGRADFVSRFFAPARGIPEDPVTASAHGALAPYWFQRLDRTELIGYQDSARGGFVTVSAAADGLITCAGRVDTAAARTLAALVNRPR